MFLAVPAAQVSKGLASSRMEEITAKHSLYLKTDTFKKHDSNIQIAVVDSFWDAEAFAWIQNFAGTDISPSDLLRKVKIPKRALPFRDLCLFERFFSTLSIDAYTRRI